MLTRLLVSRWYVANRPQAASGLRSLMFIRPLFRLVPDDTRIHFMRGRIHGPDRLGRALHRLDRAVLLSRASISGSTSRAASSWRCAPPGPADFGKIRAALAGEHVGEQGVQRFGADNEVLIRLQSAAHRGGHRSRR